MATSIRNARLFVGQSLFILLVAFCFSASAHCACAEDLPQLKLTYRTANQSILFIDGQNEIEVNAMRKACKELGLKFENSSTWDTPFQDFSRFHTIIAGSNNMLFFGTRTPDEAKKDRIFSQIHQFVVDGGHLFFFNTVDGRDSERLIQFGLKPGPVQCSFFELIPGRSEVLFKGFENEVPKNRRVFSWANIEIDPAMKPVAMFKRRDTEPHSHEPMFATMAFQSGRVTYTTIEPFDDGLWLIPIVAKWILNGAPTNMEQIGTNVVVDRQKLREMNTLPPPPKPPVDLKGEDDFIRKAVARNYWKELPQYAEPVKRYASLKTAWELAAEAGDFELVDLILKRASMEFSIDETQIRRELLELRRARTTYMTPELLDIAFAWSERESSLGQFEAAQQFVVLAEQWAKVLDEKPLIDLVQKRRATLDELIQRKNEVSQLLNQIEAGKLAESDYTTLGKYFCFTVKEWDRGLGYLKKGNVPVLKELATLDLSDPGQKDEVLKLANGWATAAKDQTENERTAMHARARLWYYSLLSKATAEERNHIEQELSQLQPLQSEIKFQLKLDGEARLEINQSRITWTPTYGNTLSEILVNSHVWNPEANSAFANQGTRRYASEEQEYRYAQIKKTKGRGMVIIQRTLPGRILVDLNDVPPGEDDYEFIVTIGPPPATSSN
ncbi:hypothetical protein [Planctomicrobium sp. SH527]|uniref:hypothetical protein n=1 Tax=Planctomicrobium sp. SH527 TaxID=3448123 RepID=UPI003F5C7363